MKTLLLVDGNALLYRAFFALPDFSKGIGVPTNAIHGFIGMLHKAITDYAPTHVAVCFDSPGPRLRNEISPTYQQHRTKAPDSLVSQMALAREMLIAAGIPYLEAPGYEADDILGTLSEKYKKEYKILILTGDKDILQLVDKQVTVIMLKTGLSKVVEFTPEKVVEEFGINPEQIPDYKSLMGDASDGYKGVDGIGPKTAMTLLQKYKTIEQILAETANLTPDRVRIAISAQSDNATLCKRLAVIVRNMPLDFDISKSEFTGYDNDLKQFLITYRFRTTYKRLFNEEFPEIAKDPGQDRLFE
ncbi:MAG: 5'-3' exonuclease [Candidatus Roizmanbacteria bacterium]